MSVGNRVYYTLIGTTAGRYHDGKLVRISLDDKTVTVIAKDQFQPAKVVATIRPDTVFIPYHWPGTQAANQLTNRAVDPLSKMPEFKVSAVHIERAGGSATTTDHRDFDLTEDDR